MLFTFFIGVSLNYIYRMAILLVKYIICNEEDSEND
mgnify:CR=1 FL=1